MASLIGQYTGQRRLLGCLSMAICLVFISLKLPASTPDKGIVLQGTRLIYPGSAQNGVTFTVTNHTPQNYLLQARILPWKTESEPAAEQKPPLPLARIDASVTPGVPSQASTTPFIILPPLVQFAPNDEVTLRIRLVENNLPTERESLFTLALKAIPSQSTGSEDPAKLVLALQNNLKLVYRPLGLAVLTAQQRAEQLQFACVAQALTVRNPTPYFVTLAELHLDSQAVSLKEQRMLAPFAGAVYPVKHCSGGHLVWKIINDEGLYSPEQRHQLGGEE